MTPQETKKSVMLIEDDVLFLESMADPLSEVYEIWTAQDEEEAWNILEKKGPDLILLDICLEDDNKEGGIDLLKRIKERWPSLPVIMLSGFEEISKVVKTIKIGAYDYIAKPPIMEDLFSTIERALETSEVKEKLVQRENLQLLHNQEFKMVGESEELEKTREEIAVLAQSDSPVLIQGETGTGKELIARLLHSSGPRAAQPFVAINCGAIPKDLFESELFGYKKGAFTGARSSEIGKFKLADGGTLLLDEIGELPPSFQTKLLRVLETQEFYPVGSNELERVEVHFLASTNRNLKKMVREKRFREDLYYRLNTYTIHVPPLRKRVDDIIPLVEYFMAEFNGKFNKNFTEITPAARQYLKSYSWPGNVRELENLLERIILFKRGEKLKIDHLKFGESPDEEEGEEGPLLPPEGLDEELKRIEKNLIKRAIELADGNKTKAASLLKISPPTLYYRLEKLNMEEV